MDEASGEAMGLKEMLWTRGESERVKRGDQGGERADGNDGTSEHGD